MDFVKTKVKNFSINKQIEEKMSENDEIFFGLAEDYKNCEKEEKIEKLRKMLVINEITEKFENIKRGSVDYYSLPEIKTKTIFSEYIVIKLPELSYPFVLDFKDVKKRISDYEKYKGKNIDELYHYLVNITHNNTKITEKEYEKYYEFIEKEILYSTFYQELNKEVFELIKDLN